MAKKPAKPNDTSATPAEKDAAVVPLLSDDPGVSAPVSGPAVVTADAPGPRPSLKAGFDPSPLPHPLDQVAADAGPVDDKAPPADFVPPDELPTEPGGEADADEIGNDAVVAEVSVEPEKKVYRWSVRNAFAQAHGGVQAASKEEAEGVVRDWLLAGLVVKDP